MVLDWSCQWVGHKGRLAGYILTALIKFLVWQIFYRITETHHLNVTHFIKRSETFFRGLFQGETQVACEGSCDLSDNWRKLIYFSAGRIYGRCIVVVAALGNFELWRYNLYWQVVASSCRCGNETMNAKGSKCCKRTKDWEMKTVRRSNAHRSTKSKEKPALLRTVLCPSVYGSFCKTIFEHGLLLSITQISGCRVIITYNYGTIVVQ